MDKSDPKNIEFNRIDVFVNVESEIDHLLLELSSVVRSINVQYLPILTKQIGYDIQLKSNIHEIYSTLNERLFEYMHTYDLKQLGMVKMGMSGVYPNMSNQYNQKAVLDLVDEILTSHTDIPLDHILFTQFAFRNNVNYKLHGLIQNVLVNPKYRTQVINDKDIKSVVNILYSYFNNRVRKGNRKKFRNPYDDTTEEQKVVDMYLSIVQT